MNSLRARLRRLERERPNPDLPTISPDAIGEPSSGRPYEPLPEREWERRYSGIGKADGNESV